MAELGEPARRLLDWRIPPAQQTYTRRDTALYALTVGAGADPLDARAMKYVDPWADDLAALPSMALVMGYPGFWLGSPTLGMACGLEASKVLHIEQAVELFAPLPVEAQVIGETRITGLVDKGEERGSLLLSERDIRLQASGRRLACCRQIHYLRGFGGHGSWGASPADALPEWPQDAAPAMETPTRPDQALFYRLNGDGNRLHSDAEVAKAAGFERPILHGMCTIGQALWAVTCLLLDGHAASVAGFRVRMLSPVYPGDRLKTQARGDGHFRALGVERGVPAVEGRLIFAA